MGERIKVTYKIQTVCECQAKLQATLDENRLVLAGWATAPTRGATKEPAPANTVGQEMDRFDVVWQCPVCGRNTLRSFHVGALERHEEVIVEAEPVDEEPAA